MSVGGIKEKIKKDIDDIKQEYLNGLTFHYVSIMKEVLDLALMNEKVKDAIALKLEEMEVVK